MDKKVIGIWYGGLAGLGVEIFDITNGYITYRWIEGEKVGKVSMARIRTDYDTAETYFVSKGHEIKLSECVRV